MENTTTATNETITFLFRENRATLAESMNTVVSLKTFPDLVAHINTMSLFDSPLTEDDVVLDPFGVDDSTGWDTWMVVAQEKEVVVGFVTDDIIKAMAQDMPPVSVEDLMAKVHECLSGCTTEELAEVYAHMCETDPSITLPFAPFDLSGEFLTRIKTRGDAHRFSRTVIPVQEGDDEYTDTARDLLGFLVTLCVMYIDHDRNLFKKMISSPEHWVKDLESAFGKIGMTMLLQEKLAKDSDYISKVQTKILEHTVWL